MMNFNNIIVFGDIHGEWDIIPNILRDYDLDNVGIIIAGDFGIGFDEMRKELKRIKHLSKRLNHTNSVLFAVRGNHDNPVYFNGQYDTDSVKLVPDYTVLNLNDVNILCVGGAYSVDRKKRFSYYKPKIQKPSGVIPVNDYWKDEIFIYDENKINDLKDISVVVTHSAPDIAPPYIKTGLSSWAENDIHILTDCSNERKDITKLYNKLKENGNDIKLWFYGHFHMSEKIYYENTKFIALGINDFLEINYEKT